LLGVLLTLGNIEDEIDGDSFWGVDLNPNIENKLGLLDEAGVEVDRVAEGDGGG